VLLVSAQRLVRRLCPECKHPVETSENDMRDWGFTDEEIDSKPELLGPGEPGSCSRCTNGYSGRQALLETLPVNNEAIREIIVEGGSAIQVKRKALEQGMLTLRRVGILNAIKGITAMEQVTKITMADR
jgi:type IV pilus assembly protein PilB